MVTTFLIYIYIYLYVLLAAHMCCRIQFVTSGHRSSDMDWYLSLKSSLCHSMCQGNVLVALPNALSHNHIMQFITGSPTPLTSNSGAFLAPPFLFPVFSMDVLVDSNSIIITKVAWSAFWLQMFVCLLGVQLHLLVERMEI